MVKDRVSMLDSEVRVNVLYSEAQSECVGWIVKQRVSVWVLSTE